MKSENPLHPADIVPGIRTVLLKTDTLPPATHTHCYLVGDADFVVIDPGSKDAHEQERLRQAVQASIAAGRRFVAIVLTHQHRDHVGGVEALRAQFGVPVWAHRITSEQLPRIEVQRFLEDEEHIELGADSLRCLHTPGHASGHLCLHHPRSNSLLVGDLVASEGTIVINPPDGHMGDYLESLERARALKARTLLPAHGSPIEAPEPLLTYYLNHRQTREAEVLAVLTSLTGGPTAKYKTVTPADLVPEVYEELPVTVWPLAARSLLAHLIHLAELGHAHQEAGRFRV